MASMRPVSKRPVFRRCARFGSIIAIGLGVLAATPAPASAAVTSHHVNGVQSAVSCLTKSLCVVVGFHGSAAKGDVVALHNGKPGKIANVKGGGQLYGVSCPSHNGCVAIGSASSGVSFVSIGKGGRPTKTSTPKTPAGVTLDHIACTTLHHCIVAGTDVFKNPSAIEIGTWNGHALTLHRTHGVKSSGKSLAIQGVGCFDSHCLVVGGYTKNKKNDSVIIAVHSGHPGALNSLDNETLTSVACTSASHCLAAGYGSGAQSGVIVTLSHVLVTKLIEVRAKLYGIACHTSAHCTAAGEQLNSAKTKDVGSVIRLASGKVTSTTGVSTSRLFLGVAQHSGGYVAVGEAGGAGSVVTVG